MTDPKLYLPESSAIVTIRWTTAEGFHAETRAPGASLDDLPVELCASIEAHWTPARVATWEAELAALNVALTVDDYAGVIQSHLDAKARERQYDSILSAITYRDDPNPQFSAEAAALFAWRSAVWTAAQGMLAGLETGGAPPAVEDVIAALPAFDWPA